MSCGRIACQVGRLSLTGVPERSVRFSAGGVPAWGTSAPSAESHRVVVIACQATSGWCSRTSIST